MRTFILAILAAAIGAAIGLFGSVGASAMPIDRLAGVAVPTPALQKVYYGGYGYGRRWW